MQIGTHGFSGARLRQARQSRGLFGTDLARMVGVKSQTISAYEKDKGTPSPLIMQTLADTLGFPIAFFTKPTTDESASPIFWRANNTATKVAQGRGEARLDWLKDVFHYLGCFLDFPSPNLPKVSLPPDFRSIGTEQIEEAAASCRSLWGLGDAPLTSVVGEMETNGIITAQIEVCADKLDAFSQMSEDGTPYVVLGIDKASGARRFFDASHELGHLILHNNVDQKRINDSADWKIIENQAHRFASAFLLPEASFRREVWMVSLDAFAALKPRWGASVQAMLMRSRDLGMVSPDQMGFLYREISRRGWRKKEPHDDTLPIEGPNLIPSGIRMLVEAGVRGTDQIAAELALPTFDLEEITNMPRGFYSAPRAPVVALPTPKNGPVAPRQHIQDVDNVVILDPARRF